MSKKIPARVVSVFSVIAIMLTFITCFSSNAESTTGLTVTGYIKPGFSYPSSSAASILSDFNILINGTNFLFD